MKKLAFSIFLLTLLFACQNDQVESLKSKPNYSEITANLNKVYSNTFQVALKSNLKDVHAASFKYLISEFQITNLKLDPNKLIRENSNARANETADLDLSYLTLDQQVIAQPFLNNVLSMDSESELSKIDLLVNEFNQDVITSTLSEEQKLQLLSISSTVNAGVQIIADTIETHELKNIAGGRTNATRWDVRGALRSGVIGLGIGAIGGGKVGCAGGTVVFPGLGTATGCVGGAVIGGAVGFISGVAGSLLQDFIFN